MVKDHVALGKVRFGAVCRDSCCSHGRWKMTKKTKKRKTYLNVTKVAWAQHPVHVVDNLWLRGKKQLMAIARQMMIVMISHDYNATFQRSSIHFKYRHSFVCQIRVSTLQLIFITICNRARRLGDRWKFFDFRESLKQKCSNARMVGHHNTEYLSKLLLLIGYALLSNTFSNTFSLW